jgi:hypothetical protein
MHRTHRINTLIRIRIRRQTRRVQVIPNPLRIIRNPITHRVILRPRIRLLKVNSDGHEISPSLAHTTRLEDVKASGVGGAAGEAVGHAVGVLVDYDAGVETAVAVGRARVPDVHAHHARLSIRRGSEVGIVRARPILRIQNNRIPSLASRTIVVSLEVPRRLVEAERVEEIMVHIRGVEELGDRRVDVLLRVRLGEGVAVLEFRAGSGGAVVVGPAVVAVVVGLRDAVVAFGVGVGGLAVALPGEFRGILVGGVGFDGAAAPGGVVGSPWAVGC